MKLATTIARYLLGALFTVFGLNGFLQFLPQPPLSSPLAMQYITALIGSHYMVPVFLIEITAAFLLLANRYVPLALAVLAPVIVNILLFHVLMDSKNIGPGLLVTLLWFMVFTGVRSAFSGLLRAHAEPGV